MGTVVIAVAMAGKATVTRTLALLGNRQMIRHALDKRRARHGPAWACGVDDRAPVFRDRSRSPARARLSRDIADIRASLGTAADRWRWVGADLVHVTLHFLGELDDAAQARVRAATGFSIPRPPFDVSVSTLGTFPPERPSQVLWLGLTAGAESLAEVHRDLTDRLADADVGLASRPFSPHLTIARARGAARVRRRRSATSVAPIVWRVDRVTLYASDLSGAAPRYTPRHVVRLADAP